MIQICNLLDFDCKFKSFTAFQNWYPGGQKSWILIRHSLWTAPKWKKVYQIAKFGSTKCIHFLCLSRSFFGLFLFSGKKLRHVYLLSVVSMYTYFHMRCLKEHSVFFQVSLLECWINLSLKRQNIKRSSLKNDFTPAHQIDSKKFLLFC